MVTEVDVHAWMYHELANHKIRSSSDPSDFPDIKESLSEGSKQLSGNQGYPDHICFIGNIPVIMEDKLGTSKQINLGKEGIFSTSQSSIAGYAENGLFHYMKCMWNSRKFDVIFGIADTYDSEKIFIIRPYIAVKDMGIIHLPCLSDYRKLNPSQFPRYIERCREYIIRRPRGRDELMGIASKIRNAIPKTYLDAKGRNILMASLLVMNSDRRFSRTLLTGKDRNLIESVLRNQAVRYTTYWQVAVDNAIKILRNGKIVSNNIIRRVLDIIDDEMVSPTEYHSLLEAFLDPIPSEVERMAVTLCRDEKGTKTYLPSSENDSILRVLDPLTESRIYMNCRDEKDMTVVYMSTLLSNTIPQDITIHHDISWRELWRNRPKVVCMSLEGTDSEVKETIAKAMASVTESGRGIFIIPNTKGGRKLANPKYGIKAEIRFKGYTLYLITKQRDVITTKIADITPDQAYKQFIQGIPTPGKPTKSPQKKTKRSPSKHPPIRNRHIPSFRLPYLVHKPTKSIDRTSIVDVLWR